MLSDDPYFDAVYADSYPVLLRYAMLRLPDPFDAEDVLQNVYVRFLRRLARRGHADIDQPGAFLLRMLRNEIAVAVMIAQSGGGNTCIPVVRTIFEQYFGFGETPANHRE